MKTPKRLQTKNLYVQVRLKNNGAGHWQMSNPNSRKRKWEKLS